MKKRLIKAPQSKILVLGIVFIILFLSIIYAWSSSLNQNLIVYYTFNTSIDSISGLNLKNTSDLNPPDFTSVSCLIGGCSKLNNTNSFNTSLSIEPNLRQANKSLNIWINYSKGLIGGVTRSLFYYGGGNQANRGWSLTLYDASENSKIEIGTLCTSTFTSDINFTTPGKWVMITLTTNDTTLLIYRNGVYNNSCTLSKNTATYSLYIGKNPENDLNNIYNITIDEMSIYNKQLNSLDITELYNSGAGLTFTSFILVLNETYNTNSIIGNTENFEAIIGIVSSETLSNAYLWYNNTKYTGSFTNIAGNIWKLTKDITVPLVSSVKNITFFWEVNLLSGYSTNTTQHNQSISPISIDNCTDNTQNFMNLFLYDEDTFQEINGTVKILLNFYPSISSIGSSVITSTYNNTLNYLSGNPIRLCASNISNYSVSYKIKYYGNLSYFEEYKNIQNLTINPNLIPQNISLYDLQTSQGYPFKINIRGESDNSNLLVDVQRQYLNLNRFVSVESLITDTTGGVTANLVENTVVYNFIISKNGHTLGSFNNYAVKCDNVATGQCIFTLNIAQATANINDFNNYYGISYSYLLNNETRELQFIWSSTDGNAHTVKQDVLRSTDLNNRTICTRQDSTTSATYECIIETSYSDANFISQIYIDGIYAGSRIFSFKSKSSEIFYGVRTLLMLLLYSCLVMLMLSNPILIVIGSMFGIFLGMMLLLIEGGGIFSNLAVFGWFLAAGVILIWQMSRRLF